MHFFTHLFRETPIFAAHLRDFRDIIQHLFRETPIFAAHLRDFRDIGIIIRKYKGKWPKVVIFGDQGKICEGGSKISKIEKIC